MTCSQPERTPTPYWIDGNRSFIFGCSMSRTQRPARRTKVSPMAIGRTFDGSEDDLMMGVSFEARRRIRTCLKGEVQKRPLIMSTTRALRALTHVSSWARDLTSSPVHPERLGAAALASRDELRSFRKPCFSIVVIAGELEGKRAVSAEAGGCLDLRSVSCSGVSWTRGMRGRSIDFAARASELSCILA